MLLVNTTDEVSALLDYLPDVVLQFDRTLRCTYANPAVERVSGANPDNFLGKTLDEFGLSDGQTRIWIGAVRRVFATGVRQTLEAQLNFDNVEWRCQAVLLPQPLDGMRPVESVLVIAHDVAEQTRLAREYHEFTTQLREHERRLRDFIERALGGRPPTAPVDSDQAHDLLLNLTPHERDLLRLVAEGNSNAAIGKQLGLSGGTVRNQLTRLYLKLGVADRTHAAARAVRLGLIRSEL